MEGLSDKVDLIITNPPYLTHEETEERLEEGWKEPALALDGGEDGLDLIRIIVEKSPENLSDGGMLLMEASPPQMGIIEGLLEERGFQEIRSQRDLRGDERVIGGVLW